MGFEVGDASACVFVHRSRRIRCAVYGNDLTNVGPKAELDWLKKSLEAKYELKESGRLGPGQGDDKEARILNRVVRWCTDGLEYEADPRQGERLLKDLGLEGSKPVSTPGTKPSWDQLQEDQELPPEKHGPYRAVAARANCLAADRPESQFACKESCRWMAKPSALALAGLKRFGDSSRDIVA